MYTHYASRGCGAPVWLDDMLIRRNQSCLRPSVARESLLHINAQITDAP